MRAGWGGLVYFADSREAFIQQKGKSRGSLWLNHNVTVLGSPGNRYVIMGWQRLTDDDGTNNVLNVDYVELRVPVGGS